MFRSLLVVTTATPTLPEAVLHNTSNTDTVNKVYYFDCVSLSRGRVEGVKSSEWDAAQTVASLSLSLSVGLYLARPPSTGLSTRQRWKSTGCEGVVAVVAAM